MNTIKRNIIFDGQVFQSEAWERGMGKYSLCLLRFLVKNSEYPYDNTYIVFNKHMGLRSEVKNILKIAAPSAKMLFIDLKVPEQPNPSSIENLQKHNSSVLEDLVSGLEGMTDFFILSLFIDQVCTVFPSNARKILLFYDLIPLQYSERYGKSINYHNYLARFKTIFEADLILTISQTVADDLSIYLGINNKILCNINGAPIERDHQVSKRPKQFRTERYVLMPSGNDLRKNNLRAVQAFELYQKKYLDSSIRLVITSYFDETTKQQLLMQSSRLIFTGNVSESNLHWLYKHAEALLFVSEYEGLGLPILEAAELGKPIVCSNLSVFNEMSKTAFYYANQLDPLDIAESLKSALDGIDIAKKTDEYVQIAKRYTWDNTAQKALKAIWRLKDEQPYKKPRIAILTPNPAGYSAIGKVVMQLHPAMSKHFDIDYYLEDGKTHGNFSRPSYLPDISRTFPATKFNAKQYRDYDAVIYNLGNSEYHVETIKNALHLPGYAIIHDTHLKSIFHSELLDFNYIDESRLEAERTLNELQKTHLTSYLSSLTNNQLGVVVHSDYGLRALSETSVLGIPISRTNLPTATPLMRKSNTNKKFTIGFAGIIHEAKGLNIVEQIINSSAFIDANIAIFGIPLISDEIMSRLESYPNVDIQTNLTDFEFQTKLSELDVLINYRPHHNGETSLTTIEAMRFGVVPVVRDVGWFKELPDDCAIKAKTSKNVVELLEDFRLDTTKREAMSKNASELIKNKYSYENYAQDLADLINSDKLNKDNINNQLHKALKKGASLKTLRNIIANSDLKK